MTDLILQKTITSIEIAHLSGKRHADVMRDIRAIEDNLTNGNLRSLWESSSYVDSKGEERPQYKLTKKGSLLLVTRYNDNIRLQLIDRWEELESKPVTGIQIAQMYIESEKEKERLRIENIAKSEKIEADKPKVVFAESVMGSSNSILLRDFAKLISDENFKIGQNRLFDWMRTKGYLMKDNSPYQQFIDRGYFEVIERSIGSGTETFTSKTTKITGAGQVYFSKKIKENYPEPLLSA